MSREGTILTVTENGFGKRTRTEEYRKQGRAGKGIITIKTTDRNGPVVGVLQVTDEDDLMIITDRGKIIRLRVKDISVIGRNTQGRPVDQSGRSGKGGQRGPVGQKGRGVAMAGVKRKQSVAVIGAGSWGTALARVLAENGYPVHLWCYEEEVARQIRERRENQFFLPGFRLPETVEPVTDLAVAIQQKELLLLVVPSHVFRDVLHRLVPALTVVKPGCLWISATKGIENDSLLTMTGVMKEILGEAHHPFIGCLSGPSFAREVARELPTAIALGAPQQETAEKAQRLLANGYFRVYTNLDILGVEMGGALKNVIALAAGISDGLGLGHNARSALITRGLAEISRLGDKMGARQSTFFGLAGIGDLVLTCTGDLSRNRTVGLRLGQGEKLNGILCSMTMVAEGVKTARAAYQLALREQMEMPIVTQVYGILYENQAPRRAVRDLMNRNLKSESGDYE